MAAVTDEELLYHRTFLPYRPAPVPTCSTGCHSSPQQNDYARQKNDEDARRAARNALQRYETSGTPGLDAARSRTRVYSTKDPSFRSVQPAQQQPQQPGVGDPDDWRTKWAANTSRRFNALRYVGGVLHAEVIVEKLDQKFKDYATPWELTWSALCGTQTKFANFFFPIVDADWTVIGHYGAVSGGTLIKAGASGVTWTGTDLSEPLKDGPIFVTKRDYPKPTHAFGSREELMRWRATAVYPPPKGWGEFAPWLDTFLVATSIDGEVLDGQKIEVYFETLMEQMSWKGVLLAWAQGALLVLDLALDAVVILAVADLVAQGAKLVAKSLVRRAMRRAALRGAIPEMTARYVKRKAGSFAQGLKLSRGYDKRMGIPEEHLTKMSEAAKETKSIAVFRANKSAAIPLIRKGAVPKGKYFTFKSSPRTGVLMATEPEHVATAYRNGYFVVDADGVARNTAGGVTKELQLKNPFWTVEKGQVIAANGKPVVGDYDLLGVMPLESPGSNVVGVPEDPMKGDWMGPYVEKYAKAVNGKFDQPRVLHGAQDQFSHAKYGGLTNDTAYAVLPDGSTYVMEGRAAQAEFYKAYKRQTIMGQYPRPAPGTAVKDEVGAMRARRQGGR
jgi:hypothetical protein